MKAKGYLWAWGAGVAHCDIHREWRVVTEKRSQHGLMKRCFPARRKKQERCWRPVGCQGQAQAGFRSESKASRDDAHPGLHIWTSSGFWSRMTSWCLKHRVPQETLYVWKTRKPTKPHVCSDIREILNPISAIQLCRPIWQPLMHWMGKIG